MKKFRKLKINLRFFDIFYFKYIKLVAKFKFVKKKLLQKFIYKLFPIIQKQLNTKLKYFDNITNLAIYYWKIYNQIIAIN